MIRLAVIGLGAVTRNIHLPAYRRLKGRVTFHQIYQTLPNNHFSFFQRMKFLQLVRTL